MNDVVSYPNNTKKLNFKNGTNLFEQQRFLY